MNVVSRYLALCALLSGACMMQVESDVETSPEDPDVLTEDLTARPPWVAFQTLKPAAGYAPSFDMLDGSSTLVVGVAHKSSTQAYALHTFQKNAQGTFSPASVLTLTELPAVLRVDGDQFAVQLATSISLYRPVGSGLFSKVSLPFTSTISDMALSGDTLAVSYAGAVRVYRIAVNSFTEEAVLIPQLYNGIPQSNYYGRIALSGDTLAVGAPHGGAYTSPPQYLCFTGRVDVWRRTNAVWSLEAHLTRDTSEQEVLVSGAFSCPNGLGYRLDLEGSTLVTSSGFKSAPATTQVTQVFVRGSAGWTRRGQLPYAHDSISTSAGSVLLRATDNQMGLASNYLPGMPMGYELDHDLTVSGATAAKQLFHGGGVIGLLTQTSTTTAPIVLFRRASIVSLP